MFMFGRIDIEKEENPVLWHQISSDDFDLIMKCKSLYEQCLVYSGRNVHEANSAAENLLNGVDRFFFSFTKKFITKKLDVDRLNESYAAEGGWEGYTRKFLVEQAIPRALKALQS